MRRFFRFVSLIFVLLIFFVFGVVSYPRRVPITANEDLQKYGFSLCAGELCFMGIKPEMSWGDVVARFKDQPNIQINADDTIGDINSISFSIVTFDEISVQEMYMEIDGEYTNAPRLSSIIAVMGSPCAVLYDTTFGETWIIYAHHEFYLNYIHNNMPITSISMSTTVPFMIFSAPDTDSALNNCDAGVISRLGHVLLPWKGFTSIERDYPTGTVDQ